MILTIIILKTKSPQLRLRLRRQRCRTYNAGWSKIILWSSLWLAWRHCSVFLLLRDFCHYCLLKIIVVHPGASGDGQPPLPCTRYSSRKHGTGKNVLPPSPSPPSDPHHHRHYHNYHHPHHNHHHPHQQHHHPLILTITILTITITIIWSSPSRSPPLSSPTPSNLHSDLRCLEAKSMAWSNIR